MSDKSIGEWSYEQFAERYAAIIEHKPHNAYLETPATRSLLPDLSGLQVLDAGCGPGQNAAWMLDQGAAAVTAIDITPDFVRMAGERLASYGNQAVVRRADLTQPLHFAGDESFDLVISQLVLHYIDDWTGVCGEFYRVLKPGGTLVFSTGHPFGDWMWASRILGEHSYFEKRLFDASWGGFGEPRPVVRSYRRPLMDTLNPVIKAGFHLEELLESQPTEDYKKADPEDYEDTKDKPTFLCVRAGKVMTA